MDWIDRFDLLLFDFDGLLVNTEELHFLAYKRMLQEFNIQLSISFEQYCQKAHYTATALQEYLYETYPSLKKKNLPWEKLYEKKKMHLLALVDEGHLDLMPGVFELLTSLLKAKREAVVVTHSPLSLIKKIRDKHPILKTVPSWITREDYTVPKPNPECYKKALREFGEGKKVVGFEDTPRGIEALSQTSIKPVMISKVNYPELDHYKKRGVEHFQTFLSIPNTWGG